MNVTDLITDRMHENLNPRDINEFEKYRWLVEMIAIEYAKEQVKNCSIPDVSCFSAEKVEQAYRDGWNDRAIGGDTFHISNYS